jgi:hypothetical protein
MDSPDVAVACSGMHCWRLHSDEAVHWPLVVTNLLKSWSLNIRKVFCVYANDAVLSMHASLYGYWGWKA